MGEHQNKYQYGVVIPTAVRNFSHVKETIDSLLMQTLTPKEIIVSADIGYIEKHGLQNHMHRLQAYISDNHTSDTSLIYVENNTAMGPSITRNIGYNMLSADIDFVAFSDDDDVHDPSHYEKMFLFLEKENLLGKLGILGTGEYQINQSGDALGNIRRYPKMIHGRYYEFNGSFFRTSSILLERKLFEQSGGFDGKYSTAEDLEFFLRVLSHYPEKYFGNIPETLIGYRVYSGNISHTQKWQHVINTLKVKTMYYPPTTIYALTTYIKTILQLTIGVCNTNPLFLKFYLYIKEYLKLDEINNKKFT